MILHPGAYQLMPPLAPEAYEALKADIAERGVITPIDVDENGAILDGHNRYRAWRELTKNEPPPTIIRSGLSEGEKRSFARKANALRRHLTRDQLRQLIAQQLRDTPTWANNRIGKELGADAKTVASVRSDLERTSEIPKLDRLIGADGKARRNRVPATRAAKAGPTPTSLPDEVKLALFEAGISAKSVTAMPGPSPRGREMSAEEEKPWRRFAEFLVAECGFDPDGAAGHVSWLINNRWKSPAEWLGEEGFQFRQRHAMREPPPAFLAGFQEHCLQAPGAPS